MISSAPSTPNPGSIFVLRTAGSTLGDAVGAVVLVEVELVGVGVTVTLKMEGNTLVLVKLVEPEWVEKTLVTVVVVRLRDPREEVDWLGEVEPDEEEPEPELEGVDDCA